MSLTDLRQVLTTKQEFIIAGINNRITGKDGVKISTYFSFGGVYIVE